MASSPPRRLRLVIAAGLVLILAGGPAAEAARGGDSGGGLLSGVGDLVGAAFALPVGILQGTLSGPPILGTVGGALGGALNTLSLATRGVFRLLGVAIPLAAKVAPLIPLFL